MGRADKDLTPRQAALLAIAAADGVIEGRTALQKIMYFVGVSLATDFDHQAHYYGPYSRLVEYEATRAGRAGDVTETIERFGSYSSGPDIRKYTYALTAQGSKVAREAAEAYPTEAELVRETVEAIRESVPNLDQHTLSMAAKIHYIVVHREDATPLGDIPSLARELGWSLSDRQVDKSVELLKQLGLLTVE